MELSHPSIMGLHRTGSRAPWRDAESFDSGGGKRLRPPSSALPPPPHKTTEILSLFPQAAARAGGGMNGGDCPGFAPLASVMSINIPHLNNVNAVHFIAPSLPCRLQRDVL